MLLSLSLTRFSQMHLYALVLKKSGHLSHVPTFMGALRRSYPINSYINIGTQYKSRCPFSGYSRGLRFNISRLQLLKLSYRGVAGSFFGARW